MKIVMPGGSGQVGRVLSDTLRKSGHQVVVLGRGGGGVVAWDGVSLGAWAKEVDGADAVINLAGKNVNCRYTEANRREMFNSRVHSTRIVGEAIRAAARPPLVWLQMSTATLYAHRFDAPNDEYTGLIGGGEPGAPSAWSFSVELAKAWERTQAEAETPHTRKVALRTTLVMSPQPGGIFAALLKLAQLGVGGAIAGGAQYMSWIHEHDFLRAIQVLLSDTSYSGPVNLGAPHPLPQRDFMSELRKAWGTPLGLPATRWMIQAAAFFLRTEPELVLKSRRVVPARLLGNGFFFQFPDWKPAAEDLVAKYRKRVASDRSTA